MGSIFALCRRGMGCGPEAPAFPENPTCQAPAPVLTDLTDWI
jgi:hypothetical protein